MEENVRREEVEIDLREVFGLLWERKWIILLTGIVAGLAVLLATQLFIEPKFQSKTKIYILNQTNSTGESNLSYSDLQTGTLLTKDYAELITARPVAEEVISVLDLNMDYDELVRKISVTNDTDTRIIAITVEDHDPYLAKDIADAVRLAASEHIANVMTIEAVRTVEDANTPTKPSSPNVVRNTAIGLVAGVLIAAAIVILLYMLNDSIRTADDVERYLGLSVLGAIPLMEGERKSKRTRKAAKVTSASASDKAKAEKRNKSKKKQSGNADPTINDISNVLKNKEG